MHIIPLFLTVEAEIGFFVSNRELKNEILMLICVFNQKRADDVIY